MIKTAAQIMAELAALGGDEEAPRKRGRPRLQLVCESFPCGTNGCEGPMGSTPFCRKCRDLRARRSKGHRRFAPGLSRPHWGDNRPRCGAAGPDGVVCEKVPHKTRLNRSYNKHRNGALSWL